MGTIEIPLLKFPLESVLLLFIMLQVGLGAQWDITITNPTPTHYGIAKSGNQIGSALLGSNTPAFLLAVVSSADVNKACTQIVTTGVLSFNTTVHAVGSFTKSLPLEVTYTSSCLAASDGSGTQLVVRENDGRQSAVVCPNNAASTGCNMYDSCGGGCFPGDATTTLASGKVKPMTDLALGDKVAVRKRDGQLAYEDVYAFGHKDAMAVADFVQLTLNPVGTNASGIYIESRVLELSASHFAPLVLAENEILYKRGGNIMVGDHMLGEGALMYVVTSISKVEKAGLYNPFTLGGTIIVNGVVVSTHSDWFLDAAFDFLGWEYWLPAAYQMVLFPVRLLYFNLGKELYISWYHQLDALVNIAALGTSYGASIFAGMGTSFAMIVALLLSKGLHSLSSNTIGKKC